MADQMKWTNALSTRSSLEAAVKEVVEQAQQSLDAPADLGLVFISSAFASEYSRLMPLLQEYLSVPALIGCGGGGIIGMNRQSTTQEIEGEPALSLTLAHLPGVTVRAFHIPNEDLPDLDSAPNTWVDLIGVEPADQPQFILLSDPFTSGINDLIEGLDFAYPGASKIGGLASGSGIGSGIGLFSNYRLHRDGTVGLALSGNIIMETIVAQGCRPIGQTYHVSAGERNVVLGLEEQAIGCAKSRTPLEVLRELIQSLNEEDRQLAQNSLFVGVARDEFKQELDRGDFLIRTLLGVDPKAGAIAIGDRVRPGQRIQFHLRDARTSAEDLEMLLERYQRQASSTGLPAGVGALMFSCVGRGEGLYGKANFDSQLFNQYLKNIPLSGFFCNGEIGPVCGSTFLHGYTSVFGICRQL
ncbi:FIST C-terminal domain-containing protein [Microcoleus sp. FACHB-672]|nr:FIST C-terminal domain-containing protein [Microcoleus sp. FACHB-672]